MKSDQICPVKFLGMHLEPGLGWGTHISFVEKKVCIGIFMIRVLRPSINLQALITVYFAHVYSHLSYGIVLWGNHSDAKKLLVLQKKVLRIICGVPPREHCKPLFERLGLLTVPAIYVLNCLLYVKKNIQFFTTCNNVHTYSTRQENNLFINYNRFSRTLNSFEVVALKLYNALPNNVKNLSVNVFKHRIQNFLLKNPIYKPMEFFHLEGLNGL